MRTSLSLVVHILGSHLLLLLSYIIVGGLVFMRLTLPFLSEWGEDWWNTAPRRLVDKVSGNVRRAAVDEELVILSYILVDQINYGCVFLSVMMWCVLR